MYIYKFVSLFYRTSGNGEKLNCNTGNAVVANVSKQFRSNEMARKREELQRRIEETRKKLQSVIILAIDLLLKK